MINPDDKRDDDALAAEYVLHLLDAQERVQFEDRLHDDAHLRGLVFGWEAHLATLANNIQDVDPPKNIKAAILTSITSQKPRKSVFGNWFVGLGGLAAAAALVLVLLGPNLKNSRDFDPSFQAELSASDGTLILIAGVIPETHEIVIDLLGEAAPLGRVLELWLIAQDADAPVSLGLLKAQGQTRIIVPDNIASGVRNGTIAISVEPTGGSTVGAPTVPVIATGTFVAL